jgi:hypothetical protein
MHTAFDVCLFVFCSFSPRIGVRENPWSIYCWILQAQFIARHLDTLSTELGDPFGLSKLDPGCCVPRLAYKDALPYQKAISSEMGMPQRSQSLLGYQTLLSRCGREDGKGAQFCCHVSVKSTSQVIYALMSMNPDHYDAQMRKRRVHKNLKGHEWRGAMHRLDNLASRHQRKIRMRILGKIVLEDRLQRSRSRYGHKNSGISRSFLERLLY